MLQSPDFLSQLVNDEPERAVLKEELRGAVDAAANLLPIQGPIAVFIFLHQLMAFEDQPFDEAVKTAHRLYGANAYLPEEEYRQALSRGRIRFSELREALRTELGAAGADPVPAFGTRYDLRMAMLLDRLRGGLSDELVWYMEEVDSLKRVRDDVSSTVRLRLISETHRWVMRDLRIGEALNEDPNPAGEAENKGRCENRTIGAVRKLLEQHGESKVESWSENEWEAFALRALWTVCMEGIRGLPSYVEPPAPIYRHRDYLLKATGEDADLLSHDFLIRFTAAYLDQGMAPAEMPFKSHGFYEAFCDLYSEPFGPPDRWRKGLDVELCRLKENRVNPVDSIFENLRILGVERKEWPDFISATLLALRGWAGIIHQIEQRPDRVVRPVPAGTLIGFLAVRLILDRFAVQHLARESMSYDGPLYRLRETIGQQFEGPALPSLEQRTFRLFQLAQLAGVSADVLSRLHRRDWAMILREVEEFGAMDRRRIFHLAYEKRFAVQALDALAVHSKRPWHRPQSPDFQVATCIDAREESFRRHLEEIHPNIETFGIAGFYGVPMYYRGAADAHFTPLCPVVVTPKHWVVEEVGNGHEKIHHRRALTRKVLGSASHRLHRGSRTIASGSLLAGTVGVLATFPLVAGILFPRLTERLRQRLGKVMDPPPQTHLHLERHDCDPGSCGEHIGFSLEEMVVMGRRGLEDMGLTSNFARLVFLFGHGSQSVNNPYNSAYHCGACSGAAGGPNARAMSQILNDRRVRERLAAVGITIPKDTIFVGCSHNTCNDSVEYYDVEDIPGTHRAELQRARSLIEEACERNAHERCRRFYSAPLTITPKEARLHVEGRAADLAQTRPEFGNATNALTIVGRRGTTRGLYLDRRSFLTSYDPTNDDEDCSVLTRILLAVFPVCSGINLQYYFSRVDNRGFGSGTKLPHNLTSLLGIMDGAASDLRPGLPWQGVEIHEPVRSLFIIEVKPEKMLAIMDRNEVIGRLVKNEWVQLAVIDPETNEISVYQDGVFEPYRPETTVLPKAPTSLDWYRGWRDHLEFCQIEASRPRTPSGVRSRLAAMSVH